MKTIGILETGRPPRSLQPAFGSYATMSERLLGDAFTPRVFHVEHGEMPDRPAACDGYLVTGSPASVYDDLPWIEPLKAFLRAARSEATPLVGICFGHQIMGEAFGGRVAKSDKGWGLGLHEYTIATRAPWMGEDNVGHNIAVPVSHQDQLVVLPPDAQLIAGSDFTPYAMLAYAGAPAISMQCHPEFEPDFVAALVERQRATLGDAQADAALAALERPNDRARLTGWIRRFLS